MSISDLMSMTIAETGAAMRAGQISPTELTQACLDHIGRYDSQINSFLTVLTKEALDRAKRAEAEIASGNAQGPFHGIPYAVKDIYNTKGIRTTIGSSVFQDNVAKYDSTAVVRLNAAGGILIGKNHCLEFASGNHNKLYGEVRNPWNLDHTPGGSSSGSGASVAAGMVFGSMGSCTGGSIRGPASHNSIVGLKPTYGLVSRFGVFPLSWSIDHAGPMTRTVEDCAIKLGAVAGYDAQDPSSARVPIPDYQAALDGNIRGLRVGVPRELNETASPVVRDLIQRAIIVLQELGAEITEVSLPITGEYTGATGNIITWSEMAQVHAPWLEQLDDYTPMVQQKVRLGLVSPATMYHKAQQLRRLIQAEFTTALQSVDVLVSPVQNTPPGPIQQASIKGAEEAKPAGPSKAARGAADLSQTRPTNLTGQPAVSVPCGFSPEGLPVGLQISGRVFEDALVLKVAHAYEQATEWHNMHPNLVV